MTQQMAAVKPLDPAVFEKALVQGDLAKLSPAERLSYYQKVCESLGLNPLTQPFAYLMLKDNSSNDKLVLYATKACTDQLRQIHGIKIEITDKKLEAGVFVVTARASTEDGRADEDIGAVPVEKENGTWQSAQSGKRFFKGDGTFRKLQGDALANALMKAITKAKRRVTLSICGLGMLDESEIETIPNAEPLHDGPKAVEGPQQPTQAEQPKAEQKTTAVPSGSNGKAAADAARVAISKSMREQFASSFEKAATRAEVDAVGDTITKAVTDLMLPADVEGLRVEMTRALERTRTPAAASA